jgi:hypothetical protein
MKAVTTTHLTVAKWVSRYLKNTVDFGLFFSEGSISLNAVEYGKILSLISLPNLIMI